MAIREVYPSYTIYPNVALSCVIDDKIIAQLSAEEKRFFFKTIIDCVVFDQHNNYKPIYFFELDSSHHDSPEQQKKIDIKIIFSLLLDKNFIEFVKLISVKVKKNLLN